MHLDVLDFKVQERGKELEALNEQVAVKSDEVKSLSDRMANFDDGLERLHTISDGQDTAPKYNLLEPMGLMSAKPYKTTITGSMLETVNFIVRTRS